MVRHEMTATGVQILTFCGALIFSFGVLDVTYGNFFATAPKIGKTYCISAIFSCGIQFYGAVFGWMKTKFLYFCVFVLRGLLLRGDYGSFILVPLKKTWGTLDPGIAVHSGTGTQW